MTVAQGKSAIRLVRSRRDLESLRASTLGVEKTPHLNCVKTLNWYDPKRVTVEQNHNVRRYFAEKRRLIIAGTLEL